MHLFYQVKKTVKGSPWKFGRILKNNLDSAKFIIFASVKSEKKLNATTCTNKGCYIKCLS